MNQSLSPSCSVCQWLNRISSRRLLVLLASAYLLIAFGLFPTLASDAGVRPLDLYLTYGASTAYDVLFALGPEGRRQYLLAATTIDVLYPLVYSLMFAVWLTQVLDASVKHRCIFQTLPFAVLLLDLLENGAIVVLLMNYPDRLAAIAQLAGLFTASKWVLAATVIGASLLFTARATRQRREH